MGVFADIRYADIYRRQSADADTDTDICRSREGNMSSEHHIVVMSKTSIVALVIGLGYYMCVLSKKKQTLVNFVGVK